MQGTKNNLQGIIEVSDLAKVIKELVDARLVILNKRVECDHIGFFCVGGFVSQILQHLSNLRNRSKSFGHVDVGITQYQSKCPAGMFRWNTVNQHISLRCNNRWVDETKEEESANERANGVVRGFRILALKKS